MRRKAKGHKRQFHRLGSCRQHRGVWLLLSNTKQTRAEQSGSDHQNPTKELSNEVGRESSSDLFCSYRAINARLKCTAKYANLSLGQERFYYALSANWICTLPALWSTLPFWHQARDQFSKARMVLPAAFQRFMIYPSLILLYSSIVCSVDFSGNKLLFHGSITHGCTLHSPWRLHELAQDGIRIHLLGLLLVVLVLLLALLVPLTCPPESKLKLIAFCY